jgi:hypothetical protein
MSSSKICLSPTRVRVCCDGGSERTRFHHCASLSLIPVRRLADTSPSFSRVSHNHELLALRDRRDSFCIMPRATSSSRPRTRTANALLSEYDSWISLYLQQSRQDVGKGISIGKETFELSESEDETEDGQWAIDVVSMHIDVYGEPQYVYRPLCFHCS